MVPSIAAADNPDWYLGVDLGRTTASQPPGHLVVANSFGMSFPVGDPALKLSEPTSLSSTSGKVEGGVWVNPYLGFQVDYVDLGTFSNAVNAHDPHKNICYFCVSPPDYTSNFSDTTSVKVHGIVFALLGRVPLPDEFELLGKVGWLSGSSTYHERVTGLAEVNLDSSYSTDYPAWDLGVGLGWRFAPHWVVELWWEAYMNTTKQYYGNSYAVAARQFDLKGYSLGVQYHF